MNTERMIRELRNISEKHKDDSVFTGHLNLSLMCQDVADRLEDLKRYEDTGLTPDQIVEQTNAGWIPVEERLPEDYSQVMVSMYDLGWITIGTYSSHSKLWEVNSYITGIGVDVRAWCPLPEPYRPKVTKSFDCPCGRHYKHIDVPPRIVFCPECEVKVENDETDLCPECRKKLYEYEKKYNCIVDIGVNGPPGPAGYPGELLVK